MKYRTIAEAKAVIIPELTENHVAQFNAVSRIVQHGNESPVSKLAKIYDLADEVGKVLAPHMVCEKGCSHCCRIDVAVTAVEAQYIQKNVGITPDMGHTVTSGHGDTKQPCSFLDAAGTCTIYAHRPFACRAFYALDNPAFCESLDTPHVTYTSESNGMLNKLFMMIAHLNGRQPIRDIRDFFPKKLWN